MMLTSSDISQAAVNCFGLVVIARISIWDAYLRPVRFMDLYIVHAADV